MAGRIALRRLSGAGRAHLTPREPVDEPRVIDLDGRRLCRDTAKIGVRSVDEHVACALIVHFNRTERKAPAAPAVAALPLVLLAAPLGAGGVGGFDELADDAMVDT